MAIPNKQIGWSQESNLLWEVAKKVAYLGQVISSNAGEDSVGVFYVSKNYSGTGGAIYPVAITNVGVTSSNAEFLDQLANAKMGDVNKPYPDPWAARNDAFVAIANGDIQKALIVVNGGNTWTYGSIFPSLNGDTNGVYTGWTVADVGLQASNNLASLMQNNIDYFFMPNSELFGISITFAFHLGYNVDTANTKWVSGIYGHGRFISPYGTNNGFSQRMFQIANGNGEMTIEADTIICQRAWFFVNGGEPPALFKLKAKKVITDGTGQALSYIPATPVSTEATTPSNITIDIDVYQKGQKYFPYPSVPQISSSDNSRATVETRNASLNTSIRQKFITLNIKQASIHDTSIWLASLGRNSVAELNLNCNINIDSLKHELNLTKTGFLIRGGIQVNFLPTTGQRLNNNYNITIGNCQVEEAILATPDFTALTAGSANNSVTLKIGSIIKTGTYAGSTGQYLFGIPSGSSLNGQRMKWLIDVGYAESATNVFRAEELPFQGNNTFQSNVVIKGTYKVTSTSPVIYSSLPISGNTGVILDNVTLITGGAQSIDSLVAGNIYYSKQAYSNVAVNGANITTQGTFNVDANIANFI